MAQRVFLVGGFSAASSDEFGASLGPFWNLLGHLFGLLGSLGASWGSLGVPLGLLGGFLVFPEAWSERKNRIWGSWAPF